MTLKKIDNYTSFFCLLRFFWHKYISANRSYGVRTF